jgi:putative ABC transport system permease protein
MTGPTSGEGPVRGEWLYRAVIRLHPRRFLRTFGDELVACFRRTWREEVEGRGFMAELSFWRRMVSGAVSAAWEQRVSGWSVAGLRRRLAQAFQVRNDLKIGVRTLVRNPLWTLMVVLTLGIGMGPTTAVFTIAQSVLLAPLPYADGERLVRVYGRRADLGSFEPMNLAAPATAELRTEASSFERVAVLESNGAQGADVTGGERNERLRMLRVSSDYFQMLGAQPLLGRTFAAAEESADAHVIVVTERVWREHLGSAAAAVGRSLMLNGVAHTVVGVVGDAVRDPLADQVDVWLPARLAEAATRTWDNNYLTVIAKLSEGVTLEQARAELTVLEGRHAGYGASAAEKGYLIVPLKEDMVGSARPMLLVVIGAAVFLLLLTCTNVASLLLSKAATRESEFAIRKALGSGSLPLARQALVETGVLAVAGGAVGLVMASLAAMRCSKR